MISCSIFSVFFYSKYYATLLSQIKHKQTHSQMLCFTDIKYKKQRATKSAYILDTYLSLHIRSNGWEFLSYRLSHGYLKLIPSLFSFTYKVKLVGVFNHWAREKEKKTGKHKRFNLKPGCCMHNMRIFKNQGVCMYAKNNADDTLDCLLIGGYFFIVYPSLII